MFARLRPTIGTLLLLSSLIVCSGVYHPVHGSQTDGETLSSQDEIPEPVPPVYTELRDLHRTTHLVSDGRATAAIVIPASGEYGDAADHIQAAIRESTGVDVPILDDGDTRASLPPAQNLIVLGNRSTNGTLSELYDRFYTLLDLKYPGRHGYVLRSVHNPFGNGYNVILVGGSDPVGVQRAADILVEKIRASSSESDTLKLGWLMEVELGEGLDVPENINDVKIWEASQQYGSRGSFGWTTLSKRMALYYMTGDEFNAREVVRLAFPDEEAVRELERDNAGLLEDARHPIPGAYHYNAHMLILFWDLIEESPVFTDQERLDITNAFSRQLEHRAEDFTGVYWKTEPPIVCGDRHKDWEAVCTYLLGRYFNRDYPHPVWQRCIDAAGLHFSSRHNPEGGCVTNDHLFWYNTIIAPSLVWTILTDDQKAMENGVIQKLLLGQEILCTGLPSDWGLKSASLAFLNQACYLTGDGRWIYYRNRTGLDTDCFRLGQSFWPDDVEPHPPYHIADKWSIYRPSRPIWRARDSGLAFEDSFLFGSFRSAVGADSDYILLDGWNGASRNPYHTFDILELRIAGHTLLKGYHNQILTKADGLVEPTAAMDGALRDCEAVGDAAMAVGEVPNAPFCNWRRYLLHRTGDHAVIIDDLVFHTDTDNMQVTTEWQTDARGSWDATANSLALKSTRAIPGNDYANIKALESDWTSEPSGEEYLQPQPGSDSMLFLPGSPDTWMEMSFELDRELSGEFFVDLHNYRTRGRLRFYLDGQQVGGEYDHYSPTYFVDHVSVGTHSLEPGDHTFRIEVVSKHPDSTGYGVNFIGLTVGEPGARRTAEAAFRLCPADITDCEVRGARATFRWRGAVDEGEQRVAFTLLAGGDREDGTSIECLRIADNAAALMLDEPGVAVRGLYRATEAEAAVVATDRIYGHNLTSAGLQEPIIAADEPVAVDWDLAEGVMHVVAESRTRMALVLSQADTVELNGESTELGRDRQSRGILWLSEGRHVVRQVHPSDAAIGRMETVLVQLIEDARTERRNEAKRDTGPEQLQASPLPVAFSSNVGGSVVDVAPVQMDSQSLLAAAEGNRIHVFSDDGSELRTMSTDGNIWMLRWWREHQLLLAGCADDKVIAFTAEGERKWTFVSKMARELAESGKTWWYKESGHRGIHGLHTGVFLNGESQCFVGSASTIEIIDETGNLLERLVSFWGDVWKFMLMEAPEGGINLVSARWPNGFDRPHVLNNQTLETDRFGFYTVPPGHSYVNGWTAMNRIAMYAEGLNNDGETEVVSAQNGVWNRVTIWSADNRPLHNAQFGPGDKAPVRNLRGMDIADLNDDGTMEIAVATSDGLVVVLDHHCDKIWAKQLPGPATTLKCVAAATMQKPQIIIGCEDGTIAGLDAQGNALQLAEVSGEPTYLGTFDMDGATLVIGTGAGELTGLKLR